MIIVDATGFGANVQAAISTAGVVTNIAIVNGGTGYLAPQVVIDAPPMSTLWSNDGSSISGSEPSSAVVLPVTKGLYSLALGDTTLTGMTLGLSVSIFTNSSVYLRVWADDGTNGSQQLKPDQRLASSGYAFVAQTSLSNSGVGQPVSLDASNIISGTFGAGQIPPLSSLNGAITGNQLPSDISANLDLNIAKRWYVVTTDPCNTWGGSKRLNYYYSYTVAHNVRFPTACSDLIFVFSTCDTQAGMVDTANGLVGNAFEQVIGLVYSNNYVPVYFGGRRLYKMYDKSIAFSDPVPINPSDGASIQERIFVNRMASANYALPDGENGTLSADQPNLPAPNLVSGAASGLNTGDGTAAYQLFQGNGVNPFVQSDYLPDSGSVPPSFTQAYYPIAVLGRQSYASTRSLYLAGDSIMFGTGDVPFSEVNGGFGWAVRAYNSTMATVRGAIPGEQISDVTQSRNTMRGLLIPYCKYLISGYGINDLKVYGASGLTDVQVQALWLVWWNRVAAQGVRVWQTTLTPYTGSGDAWQTTNSQRWVWPLFHQYRTNLNVWLRNGAPITNGVAAPVGTPGALTNGMPGHPLKGIIDVAAAVESAANSGLWKPSAAVLSTNLVTAGTGPSVIQVAGANWPTVGNGGLGGLVGWMVYNQTRYGFAEIVQNTATNLSLGGRSMDKTPEIRL